MAVILFSSLRGYFLIEISLCHRWHFKRMHLHTDWTQRANTARIFVDNRVFERTRHIVFRWIMSFNITMIFGWDLRSFWRRDALMKKWSLSLISSISSWNLTQSRARINKFAVFRAGGRRILAASKNQERFKDRHNILAKVQRPRLARNQATERKWALHILSSACQTSRIARWTMNWKSPHVDWLIFVRYSREAAWQMDFPVLDVTNLTGRAW